MQQDLRATRDGYLIAVVATAAIVLVQLFLVTWWGNIPLLMLLLIVPVLAAAWYGGLKPGLLATTSNAAVAAYFFVEPVYSFYISHPGERVWLVIFLVLGTVISGLCEALHAARRRSEAAADERSQLEKKLRSAEDHFRLLVEGLDQIVGRRPEGRNSPADLAASTFRVDRCAYLAGIVRDITGWKQLVSEVRHHLQGLVEARRRIDESSAMLNLAMTKAPVGLAGGGTPRPAGGGNRTGTLAHVGAALSARLGARRAGPQRGNERCGRRLIPTPPLVAGELLPGSHRRRIIRSRPRVRGHNRPKTGPKLDRG
jgi:hypothetical protein